ncbi:MAG TPA: HEPN domain-containing protein [Nitrososphaeraceae archaeon]
MEYEEIALQLREIVKNWMASYTKYEPIYDLFFDSFFNKQSYLYHTFLTKIQAIESLHRRMFPNKTWLSNEEFDELKKTILNMDMSDDALKLIKIRLQYANELTLRRRLKNIIDDHKHLLQLFRDSSKISDFIDKIVNTRNYLTHYGDSLRTKSANKDELHDITDKLSMILYFLLLRVTGFNPEYLEIIFKRHWKYGSLFNQTGIG